MTYSIKSDVKHHDRISSMYHDRLITVVTKTKKKSPTNRTTVA